MSPAPAPHPCAKCGTLLTTGRCPICRPAQDAQRGTASARGYGRAWLAFRPVYIAMLVAAGIVPVCGSALPTGPASRESACRDQGLLVFTSADGSSLHLDHEPELEDWERTDPARVCDPDRIVLKCAECHARKTGRAGSLGRGGSQNVLR